MLALSVCFPQPITTEHFVRFLIRIFDEILCKLDFTEYARSFEEHPTLH